MSDSAAVETDAFEEGDACEIVSGYTTPWDEAALFVGFVTKAGLGVLFCVHLLPAVLAVGWTYRLCQRHAVHRWYRLAKGKPADPLERFNILLAEASLFWPRWFRADPFYWPGASHDKVPILKRSWTYLTDGLWQNLRIGLQGLCNTFALTLPMGVMWAFGWWGGWNLSFFKHYEGNAAGAQIALLGTVLFAMVMLYVPLAQARQAVTGEWRRFWDVRFIWRLMRLAPFGVLLIALGYGLAFLPVSFLRAAPTFIGNNNPEQFAAMSPQAVTDWFGWYALFFAALTFPLYAAVHILAVRIYAKAVYRGVMKGAIQPSALSAKEQRIFELLQIQPGDARRKMMPGTRPAKFGWGSLCLFLAFLVLMFAAFTNIVAQFFNYRGNSHWLNQPLVQIPYTYYLPPRLDE